MWRWIAALGTLLLVAALPTRKEALWKYGVNAVEIDGEENEYVAKHLKAADQAFSSLVEFPRVRSFLLSHPVQHYVVIDAIGIWSDEDRNWWAGDYEKSRARIRCCTREMSASYQRYLVRHEVGHHVHLYGDGLVDREAWKKFFDSHDGSWWCDNVSDYAKRNEREAFADVFSIYTNPDYEPGTLPRYLERWMAIITGK